MTAKLIARVSIQFLGLILVGLLAGANFGIWQGYDPRGFSPATFIDVHQNTVRGLNVLLPALGFASCALVAALMVLRRGYRPALWLYAGVLLCLVASGVITNTINQPINAQVMTWSLESLPLDWVSIREEWWRWHVVRANALMLAFALFIVALLVDRHAEPSNARAAAR